MATAQNLGDRDPGCPPTAWPLRMHVFHGEKGTRALLSARQQGGRAGRRPAVLLLILLLLSTVPVLLSSEKTCSSPGNEPQGLQGRQRPRKRVLGQQGPRARVCARCGRWVWKGVTVSQRGSHTLLLLKVPAAIPPPHHCRCHIPAMSGFVSLPGPWGWGLWTQGCSRRGARGAGDWGLAEVSCFRGESGAAVWVL